jgi:HAD superfamily hydrolase (TIGR01509 family)
MDGLMVDTEPLSRQAWDAALSEFGYALPDDVYYQMIGRRSDESSHMAWSAFDLPISAAELLARKTAALAIIRAQGVPVMPGLMPLQAEIARRNLVWGVATSSARAHAEAVLNEIGLLETCYAVTGGDEVTHSKPAPDIYLLAAERLGVNPQKCLALEDSWPGSQAAVAAGMVTIAVPNGDTQTAVFSHAHYVFPTLHEVLARLDELLNHEQFG